MTVSVLLSADYGLQSNLQLEKQREARAASLSLFFSFQD
jgi:hypothetical protein